jgi:hypothetical protein
MLLNKTEFRPQFSNEDIKGLLLCFDCSLTQRAVMQQFFRWIVKEKQTH